VETDRPWLEHDLLANMLAGWRSRWQRRRLFRAVAGPDWIRLHLEGDDRPAVVLTCLPGAAHALAHFGSLPGPLLDEMKPTRQHPLIALLSGAELTACGMLPADRVACFAWRDSRGRNLTLLHQLFGARGNTALIDDHGKLHWAWRRPPHALLTTPPDPETWATGREDGPPDVVSGPALEHLAGTLARNLARETRTMLGRRLRTAERLVANLTADFANADRGEFYRRQAEALAASLHTLSAGASAAEVPDPRTGEVMVIPLDPALGPAANMEAWFRKASKAEKGRDVIAARLETARADVTVLNEALAGLDGLEAGGQTPPVERLASLQAWRRTHLAILAEQPAVPGRRPYGPEEPGRPFRRYLIDGRWEVWVGRNNKENDELTHRAAHVRDIWFHAQGVSGSHVVLRTGGRPEQVPRAVLAKAAALAALNSKARHSSLVPVIYTEKRYVRKPRKAPAGTAVCLREKSLFVEPALPAGAVSI
jgi:predicted ribosome quality control (RQC) complex YloA/Tae2 family protein